MPSYVHLQRNSLNIQVVDCLRKNVPKTRHFMPNIFCKLHDFL